MSSTVATRSNDEAFADPVRDARALLASLETSQPAARSATIEELQQCLRALAAETQGLRSQSAVLLQQQAALKTVISSVPFFVFWKDSDCGSPSTRACWRPMTPTSWPP
jgi:hypothetical protein